jgi:glycine cleavage system H protein
MTVLIVVAFFALFITLDYVMTRRRLAREAVGQALAPAPAVEPVWVAGVQMPEAQHNHRGHTWARVLDRNNVLVGVDDFARRLLGTPAAVRVPARGDWLHQGGRAFGLRLDGKSAELVSPVEGEVVEVNPELTAKPSLPGEDPYGRGWILKVRAHNLADNLRNLLSGRLARRWMEDSREALDLRLMALTGTVLQDGGEPVDELARHLPKAEFERLVGEFLLT